MFDATVTPTRSLRIAYLTEMHLQPERGAADGVRACFRQVYALTDAPDLILNGGDLIMDASAEDWARANLQFDLWEAIAGEFDRIPVFHCLGNHDIWGWHRKSGCTGDEPLFGKGLAMARLKMEHPYYRLDRGTWRFLVLGSISRGGNDDFEARLDPGQFEWLRQELRDTPSDRHIVIVSHAPLLGGGCLFFSGTPGEREKTGHWIIPGSWLHTDARTIHDLLVRHPSVRLCLSGHTHLYEQLTYNGITYINGGSVSGRWWRGAYHRTSPGFGLLDLFSNGSFHFQYVPTAPEET
ncbi:MAG: metallophosphoesterase [Capsulimonadales bacterium]|nr:metallophosphoesterase [Capsulimonadales bacterium]